MRGPVSLISTPYHRSLGLVPAGLRQPLSAEQLPELRQVSARHQLIQQNPWSMATPSPAACLRYYRGGPASSSPLLLALSSICHIR